MVNKKRGGSAGLIIGFIIGGLIGAIVGIMLAPRSGSETRKDLKDLRQGWRTKAEEMAANIQAQVVPTVVEAKGRLGPTIEGVRGRTDPLIGTLREQVTSDIEEVSARVRRRSENGVEAGSHLSSSESDQQSKE